MGAKELLLTVAAAAATWAVAISGFSTNRPFMSYLFAVSFVLVVISMNWDRIVDHWQRRAWQKWIFLSIVVIPVVGLGYWLGTAFNQVQANAVDEQARSRADKAIQDTAALSRQVEGLSKQVETAMRFLENEKIEREADLQRQETQRVQRQRLHDALSALVEEGRRRRRALQDLKDQNAVAAFDQWLKDTPKQLRGLSLSHCADAFSNAIHGARISWNLPPERDSRYFIAIAHITAVEQCRTEETK